MRILTEDQYQRRIEEAEFHDSQEIRRRLDRLERKVKPKVRWKT